ncbi:MAG TPA: class I tRNA ligase family protein, partial [Anaerolineales bacterium]|nr:class I tRNA ligase family protein [Anaerolineales bacterium]
SAPSAPTSAPTLADSWIASRLDQLVRDVERLFQTFQYGEAGRQIYEFFWSDFADWYVEIAKQQMQSEETREQTVRMLVKVLDTSLRLLHPFTPFITEELWGHLRNALQDSPVADLAAGWSPVLITARWPEAGAPAPGEAESSAQFALLQEIVRSIRNLRAEKNVNPAKRLVAMLVSADQADLLKQQSAIIAALAGLDPDQLSVLGALPEKPAESAVLVVGSVEVYLPLSGMVDLDAERARLSKELAEAQSQIDRLQKLLGSDFANKAPAAVVAKEREKLAAYKETAEKLQSQLK